MTELEAQEITMMLAANWPNSRASDETLSLYEKILRPLDINDARAAVMELVSTSEAEFMPKPATICRLTAERRLAIEGRVMLSAEEAWAEVQNAIRRCGYYSYPANLHPRIRRAIDAMGWCELCSSENPVADRAHFFRIFEAVQQREVSDQVRDLIGSALGWLLPDGTTPAGSELKPSAPVRASIEVRDEAKPDGRDRVPFEDRRASATGRK
jgi:hypothetical protein